MKIILGSQSPGRKKILKDMGYEFEVMPSNIDEKAIRFSDPVELTLALANAKAYALLPKITGEALLVTSDQVVVCQGKIMEKPGTPDEAAEYLGLYAEHPAETVTAVAVTNTSSQKRASGTDIAKIWFSPIPEDIIRGYIGTGEPFLQAGGFDHEHPMLLPYISRIDGEKESITGLPVALTRKLIAAVL